MPILIDFNPPEYYLLDKNFIEFAVERGAIPFILRGSLTCNHRIDFHFEGFNISIFSPTYKIQTLGKNLKAEEELRHVHIRELIDETIFRGEIYLSDSTEQNVIAACKAIET